MKKQIKFLMEEAVLEPTLEVNPNAHLSTKEEAVRKHFEELMSSKGLQPSDYNIEVIDDMNVFFTVNSPEAFIFQTQYTYDAENGTVSFDNVPFKKREMSDIEKDEKVVEEEDVKEEIADDIKEGKIYEASLKFSKLMEKKLEAYFKAPYLLNESKISPSAKKKVKKILKKI